MYKTIPVPPSGASGDARAEYEMKVAEQVMIVRAHEDRIFQEKCDGLSRDVWLALNVRFFLDALYVFSVCISTHIVSSSSFRHCHCL